MFRRLLITSAVTIGKYLIYTECITVALWVCRIFCNYEVGTLNVLCLGYWYTGYCNAIFKALNTVV